MLCERFISLDKRDPTDLCFSATIATNWAKRECWGQSSTTQNIFSMTITKPSMPSLESCLLPLFWYPTLLLLLLPMFVGGGVTAASLQGRTRPPDILRITLFTFSCFFSRCSWRYSISISRAFSFCIRMASLSILSSSYSKLLQSFSSEEMFTGGPSYDLP